jgi:GNAT superfamily N-acetyltransferase
VRILEATTVEQVEAAAPLYDGPPVRPATNAFLADPRHHLLVALDDDGRTVGFISGVEMTHPDKGTEMFLYELAVAKDARQQGIGLALHREPCRPRPQPGVLRHVGRRRHRQRCGPRHLPRGRRQQNRTMRRHHLDVLSNPVRSTGQATIDVSAPRSPIVDRSRIVSRPE